MVDREIGSPEDWYDKWASSYEDSILQRLIFRPSHDMILRFLDLEPEASILDVGCGTGILARGLASQYPAGHVTGVDISSEMVDVARSKSLGIDNLEFQAADSQDLDFPDCEFDCVLCCHSFHMHPDQEASLMEMCRVLRPGGKLVIIDTGKFGIVSRLFSQLHERFTLGDGIVRTFSPKGLARLLGQAGLVHGSIRTSPLRYGLPSMLVSGKKPV